MKNRTVIKLLACLGQRNINALDSYLHSFYANQECVILFDAMKECAPKFTNRKMQTEQVWQRAFFSKKLSTNKLDKLCFQLHGHIKEFMAWQEMKEDAITREKLFLKAANRYELREVEEETLKGLISLIKEERKTEIWTNEALVEVYHHLYFSMYVMRKKDKGRKEFNELIENLDTFYLTYRTLLETESRIREYVVQEEKQEFKFEEVRNLLKKVYPEKEASSIQQTLESFLGEEIRNNAAFYDILAEKVFGLLPNLHLSDQGTILNFLAIVANYFAKQGKNEFTPKIFRIFKYAAENGSAIKNNSISPLFFVNLVDMACKSKEVKWAEKFCENYQNYLKKELRTDIILLSNSIIAFAQKDFSTAKKLLEGKRFNDQHNLRSRWLLTMVYYDSEDDKLRDHCEAFSQFLYREKLYNEMNRRGTHNFLKTINMLLSPNVRKNEIVEFVHNCTVISQRIWLDEKIKERKF